MRLIFFGLTLVVVLHCPISRAQDAKAPAYSPPALQPEVRWWRVVVEELGILLAGTGYYFIQHDVNSSDWTYDYSWATLQSKLVGDGYAFDTNFFRTNTLAHAGSGTLYFLAARGNGVGFLPSLGMGIASSTAWELLAEFRERISINDMLITPLGGAAFGEAMAQVGKQFVSGCAGIESPVLYAVFAPSHALHGWLDGDSALPRRACDRSLLSEPALRFMAGTAWSNGHGQTRGSGWLVIRADARVLTLPTTGSKGEWRTLTEDAWARLNVRTSIGVDRVDDLEVTARAVPFGAWYENPDGDARAVVGVGVGAAFSEHAYGKLPEGRDPLFVLEVPAFAVNYRAAYGGHRLDLTLLAATTFAEVGAFALPVYEQNNDLSQLTPIAASKRYNHAFGLLLAPEVRWSAAWHELTLTARSDRMVPIRKYIGDKLATSTVRGQEYRRQLRAALSFGTDERLRFRGELDWTQRRGELGEASRSVEETVWTTGLEGRF